MEPRTRTLAYSARFSPERAFFRFWAILGFFGGLCFEFYNIVTLQIALRRRNNRFIVAGRQTIVCRPLFFAKMTLF